MKYLFCFLTALFPLYLLAQHFSFSFTRSNIVYVGMNNPFSFAAEKMNCEEIVFVTHNGTITKYSCNSFNYKPGQVKDDSIIVYRKFNKMLHKIGVYYVRVRKFPDPVATVSGQSGGRLSAGFFSAQQGVGCSAAPGFDIDIDYSVKEFAISIIRNDSLIYFERTQDKLFSPQTIQQLKKLQQNDKIIVSCIKVLLADEKSISIKPIEFEIE